MLKLLKVLLIVFCIPVFAEQTSIVLLPVQGVDLSVGDKTSYRAALQEGFAAKYKVYSGSEVDKKLKVFAIKTCDETKCLQEMAVEFQTSLIARGLVVKKTNGYILTVEIKDVFYDEVVYSKSEPCRDCDEFDVVDQLKALASGTNSSTGAPPSTSGNYFDLTLKTTPSDARITLLNSKEHYQPAIRLPQGRYHIQVSKPEYITQKKWIKLSQNTVETIKLKRQPTVRFITDPPDAQIKFTEHQYVYKQGMSLPPGTYPIQVSRKDYVTKTFTLTIKEKGKKIKIKLAEADLGELIIQTNLSDVYLNITNSKGESIAQQHKGNFNKPLWSGDYTMTATKKGYAPRDYQATLNIGKNVEINITEKDLRLLEGKVSIGAYPATYGQIQIYVNKKPKGRVPQELTLPQGEYLVELKTPQRQAKRQIGVLDGDKLKFNPPLKPDTIRITSTFVHTSQTSPELLVPNPWYRGNKIASQTVAYKDAGSMSDVFSGVGIYNAFIAPWGLLEFSALTQNDFSQGSLSLHQVALGYGYSWKVGQHWNMWASFGGQYQYIHWNNVAVSVAGEKTASTQAQSETNSYFQLGMNPETGGLLALIRYESNHQTMSLHLGWSWNKLRSK